MSPQELIGPAIPDRFIHAIRPASAYRHLGSAIDQANQVLYDVELRPLQPDAWREVSRTVADRILTRILHRSLAFTSIEIVSRVEAIRSAGIFLAAFGPRARYFTNAELTKDGDIGTWMAASLVTFDAGVVVIGPEHVGVLWAAEDD